MTSETLNEFYEAQKTMDRIRNEYIQDAKKVLDNNLFLNCTKEKRGVVGHKYTVFVVKHDVAGLKAKLEFFVYPVLSIETLSIDHYDLDYVSLSCKQIDIKVDFKLKNFTTIKMAYKDENSNEVIDTILPK